MKKNALYDVLIVSPDKVEQEGIANICKEFDYKGIAIDTFEKFVDDPIEAAFVLISGKAAPAGSNMAEMLQAAKQFVPDSFLAALVADSLPKDQTKFLKKSGANLTAIASELTQSSKFPFAINQVLKASYLPLKTLDLLVDYPIPFNIFHLLPQRKKFLPCHHAGDPITATRMEKLKEIPEYYFHRSQAFEYKKYIEETSDRTGKGLAKRCRANFIALQSDFTSLVLSLTDQSEIASYTEGQELLTRLKKISEDLLTNLAEFPKAWEIVNGSAIGEFGSMERAPAIASYCGIFGIHLKIKKISEVMVVGLLSDLGLISLPPAITLKIRQQVPLTDLEMEKFKKFPQTSLNMILDRKLSMEEKSRRILLAVHERADGGGFPSGAGELRLTTDSQLVRFAQEFDQSTILRMGKPRKDPKTALREIITTAKPGVIFNEDFIKQLNENLLALEIFQ